jgi:outer membrane murein-binding lipoprotein Lpp
MGVVLMEIRDWLLTISMVGHFSYTVWAYIERRNDKTNERIAELASKVEKLDKDVSALESASTIAPNHGDLAKVYESVNKLASTVNQLVGENRAQSETLKLIHSFLLNGGRS